MQNYTHETLKLNENLMMVTFTEAGLENITNVNMQYYVQLYIYGATFPDIAFSMAGIDIRLSEITVAKMKMPMFDYNLMDSGLVDLTVPGADFGFLDFG